MSLSQNEISIFQTLDPSQCLAGCRSGGVYIPYVKGDCEGSRLCEGGDMSNHKRDSQLITGGCSGGVEGRGVQTFLYLIIKLSHILGIVSGGVVLPHAQ